jgi:aspartyl-tRNA synthetase
MKRTHTCGDLTKSEVGKKVLLQGWVQTTRDHGGKIFVDLRDRYGLTQVLFNPEINKEMHAVAESLRREFVIECEGEVKLRPADMINTKIPTGEIEVHAKKLVVLNKSETPPLEVNDLKPANDDMRLKWRFIDLRRPCMQKNLIMRHNVVLAVRKFMSDNKFLEIETPLLVKSTPEGARDYIVPSRVNKGQFYALPQSPQLYKQLLMVSGMDRYFQFAKCLRDEDLRADRQPEFTQIDLEMSFVEQDDVMNIVEGIIKTIMKSGTGIDVKLPFPRMSYKEAMEKYGSDKPDVRFGFELVDITELAKGSEFAIFKSTLQNKGIIKCVNAKACADIPDKKLEHEWTELAKEHKARGLLWLRVKGGMLDGNTAKYLSPELQKKIVQTVKGQDNDLLLFVADKPGVVAEALGHVRMKVAKHLNLLDSSNYKFLWVVDFPLFLYNEDEKKWEPAHHMFTKPQPEFIDCFEKKPEETLGALYDLVLNGIELGSGSIRINQPELQERVMKFVGFSKEQAQKKFGFLIEAFRYGAPPHGGFAVGLDRICSLMTGTNDIREVIAFPKNKGAQCPMDGCPSEVDDAILKEVNIKLDMKAKAPDKTPEQKPASPVEVKPAEKIIAQKDKPKANKK